MAVIFSYANGFAYEWDSIGLNIIERPDDSDDSSVYLSDSEGKTYIIANETKVNEQIAAEIKLFIKTAKNWKNISWNEMKFFIAGNEMQCVAYPSSISFKNEDLLPFIPGGLVFSYEEGAQRYDFRLIKNNTIIKMRGAYIEEELLLGRISEALNDPKSFMKKRDPDFLLAKIEELENKIDRAESNILQVKLQSDKYMFDLIAFENARLFNSKAPVEQVLVYKIIELKKSDSSMTVLQVKNKLDELKIASTISEIELVFAVCFNQFK